MEDEIDQILDNYVKKEKAIINQSKYLTLKFYKSIVISISMFIYLFFYTMIYPPKITHDNADQTNPAGRRINGNIPNVNNMNRQGRYRSRGGGWS